MNFLELQETTPSPLEHIKSGGIYPYLYLENLDYILFYLRSFGHKHWKLPRKISKESPLPTLCLLEIWMHCTMSSMRSDQVVPGFTPIAKVQMPKPLLATCSATWNFSRVKIFYFWLYFKSMISSWFKLCPLFLNLHLMSNPESVLYSLDSRHNLFSSSLVNVI